MLGVDRRVCFGRIEAPCLLTGGCEGATDGLVLVVVVRGNVAIDRRFSKVGRGVVSLDCGISCCRDTGMPEGLFDKTGNLDVFGSLLGTVVPASMICGVLSAGRSALRTIHSACRPGVPGCCRTFSMGLSFSIARRQGSVLKLAVAPANAAHRRIPFGPATIWSLSTSPLPSLDLCARRHISLLGNTSGRYTTKHCYTLAVCAYSSWNSATSISGDLRPFPAPRNLVCDWRSR